MQQGISTTYENVFESGHILFGLAGTLLYHEPTKVVIDALVAERQTLTDPAIQMLLPQGAPALYAALEQLAKDDDATLSSLLLQEYTALFIQRTTSKVYPWESVYTTHDHTLFGESTLEVQALYRSHNVVLGETANEPQDHIGLECMFLSLLAEKGLSALKRGDRDEAEQLFAQQRDFLKQHLFVFSHEFLAALESKAETDYYKAICLFTYDTLAWANAVYLQQDT